MGNIVFIIAVSTFIAVILSSARKSHLLSEEMRALESELMRKLSPAPASDYPSYDEDLTQRIYDAARRKGIDCGIPDDETKDIQKSLAPGENAREV